MESQKQIEIKMSDDDINKTNNIISKTFLTAIMITLCSICILLTFLCYQLFIFTSTVTIALNSIASDVSKIPVALVHEVGTFLTGEKSGSPRKEIIEKPSKVEEIDKRNQSKEEPKNDIKSENGIEIEVIK